MRNLDSWHIRTFDETIGQLQAWIGQRVLVTLESAASDDELVTIVGTLKAGVTITDPIEPGEFEFGFVENPGVEFGLRTGYPQTCFWHEADSRIAVRDSAGVTIYVGRFERYD